VKRVIVTDASALIDLRKGGLLSVLCDLPYRFVIPLPVRESEVLDFSRREWRDLDDGGVVTHNLTPEEVARALAYRKKWAGLSANDCFCLVTALAHSGMVLTGDALLRRVSTASGLDAHGVLWIVDELDAAGHPTKMELVRALTTWQRDGTVFLPGHEVARRWESLSA